MDGNDLVGGAVGVGGEGNKLVQRDEEDPPELEIEIEGGGDEVERGEDKLVSSTESNSLHWHRNHIS